MSWDLNQDELRDKFNALPTTQTPDVGLGHNFVEGAGKMAMKIAAESARAVQMAGAVVPIYQDWMTDKRKTQGIGQESAVKTVTAQERYFKSMADGPLQSAVDFWTPKPFEVGTAGEVVGSLLGMMPLIMAGPAGPSMAVGATMMSQGQNLVDQGAPAGKAAAVGTVQGLGLGLGIMAPILGRTLLERVLVGGAGFNVVQGAVTRGVSGAILEGEKASENFHAFSGKDMFIDALAGSMFGVGAHLVPAQRAQGEAAWKAISEFLGEATPTQKAAAATLLDHLHITTESLPGAPVTPADREVHIQRMAQAINDLANDRPVDVENIVKDTTPETVGDQGSPAVKESLTADHLPDAGNMVDVQTSNQPRYNPDLARIEQDQAIREAIQEHARTVAAEEGIPQIPDRKTIAQTIEEQLVQAGRPAEEAKAGATLWQAFFDTTASRYGRTGQELFDRYMKGITGQAGEGPMLAQESADAGFIRYYAARRWTDEADARANLRRLINEQNERYSFKTDPNIVDSFKFVKIGNKVRLKQEPKAREYGPIWTNEKPDYGDQPPVDWTARDLGHSGSPESARKVYGEAGDRAYEAWVPIDELPAAKGDDIRKGGLTEDSSARDDFAHRGDFPPATVRISKTGKVVIADGNHRIAYWREQGYSHIPAYVLDARKPQADPGQLFQGAVPWYHSELERQIGTAKMGAASPKDWKNYIKGLSNKGVKADEVKWTGLEEWLDLQQGKVTKEQIRQYMKDGGVKVEETTLGEGSQEMAALRKEIGTLREDIIDKQHQFQDSGYLYREVTTEIFNELPPEWQAKYQELNDIRDRYNKLADQERDDSSPTKFATYQLPGGENYRELLLTLPETGRPATLPEGYSLQEMARGDYTLVGPDGSGSILPGTLGASESYRTNAAIEMLRRKGVLPPEPTPFRSSHFDQPNILSHIRFNERTDADGKKVLFIEEIQSDWAQKGKRSGFQGDRKQFTVERDPATAGTEFEMWMVKNDQGDTVNFGATKEEAQRWADAYAAENMGNGSEVPRAPFVGKTEAWVGLSLKRMIRYAAENGFDRVAWTNGEQQAARYDLSKQMQRIVAKKNRNGEFSVGGVDVNGQPHEFGTYAPDKLADVVGKDLAAKIVNQESPNEVYAGNDLKVGGEGMKAFYDKIVPNVANDVLKKLGGGRVGEVTIDQQGMRAATVGAPDEAWPYAIYVGDREVNRIGTRRVAEQEVADLREQGKDARIVQLLDTTTKQPGFDITPSMREKAMETQALFQPERGALQFDQQGKMAIALLKSADPSTFLHESGHFFLEVTNDLASQPDAPAAMKQDMQTLYSWFGLKDADTWNNMTLDEKRPYHEQFARGFERYLRDGQAPTPVLKGLFQRFRDWLKAVYQSASQLNVEVSDQVRAVMDRMLAEPQRTEAPPEATRSATPPPPRGGVGEPMGEASVLTEVQQVREEIMAAEHTARQRWGDAIIDALYEKYAPHLEDAGQLRGMSAIMESLAEDAKPAYLMKTMGPRPKEPQSLIAAIKELGGINTSMRSDIAGPDKKGVPVSLFRKAGKNVDELALLLQEKGFLNEADIANESDNGGINKLMEMIQDEIAGNKHYSERDATQAAALREHDQFMESIDGKGESASTHFTPEEWATIQREVLAEGMAPTAKNVVDADAVSIAMQIDEARVERAAITAADDHDFMAEVREIIDGYKPQPDATAAERSTPTAAKPRTPGPAGQEANAPGADRNAGNQGVIAQQALRMVAENPDLPIATGVDAQGNTTYQKASEYLAEAKAMADLKRQDVSLFELAAQCLLGGGR